MKKIIKKSFAIFLCIVMIIVSIPIGKLVGIDLGEQLKTSAASYSVGDTVAFGTYPQSIVTDATLIDKLKKIEPDSNGDLIYEGNKYRKFKSIWGDIDYYKYQSIRWTVLSYNDNDLFLVSERVIDCKPYHKSNVDITWKDCTLRTWLNTDFYNTAFSYSNQRKIKETTLKNDSGTTQGPSKEDTTDKVFILGYKDVINEDYGFSKSSNASKGRVVLPTSYSYSAGAPYTESFSPPYNKASLWYLRGTICFYQTGFVDCDGKVFKENPGWYVSTQPLGIRPAIHLDLSRLEKESSDFKEDSPVLEDDDAINFLRFIYNQGEDSEISSSNPETINDFQYKILTGEIYNEGLSVSEIQNLIADFCWLVEIIINRHIEEASDKSNLMKNKMISFLKSSVALEKIQDIVLDYEILDMIIPGIVGISDQTIFKKMGGFLDEIQILNSLKFASSYLDIVEAIELAIKFKSITNALGAASNKFNKYLYFSTCFNQSHNSYNDWIDEASFVEICDKNPYFAFDNEKTLPEVKEDLDRWADYLYELQQHATKEFHKYETITEYPDCTSKGIKIVVCANCDEVKSAESVEPKGHTYQKTTIAPTCDNDGYDLYRCADCTYSYRDNLKEATGHIKYTVQTIKPTCLTYGYDYYVCKCGATWTDNEVEPTGHRYKETVVAPTETEQGYTVYECSDCKDKYFDDYTDPTGHEFTVTVTKPTCTSRGFTTHICNGCGYEYIDGYVDMKAHSYQLISETKATCTTEGTKNYSCKNCGTTYSETVAVKAHDYSYGTRIVAPTCEEQGYVIHICVCGVEMNDDYAEAIGHDYAVIESAEVTCVTDGFTKYECSRCGHTYSDVTSKTGHNYEFVETVAGHCLKSSYTLYRCTVCDSPKYENCVYADGHDMGDWVTVREATSTKKGLMKRICDDCDYYETKDIKYSIYISIIEPTERTVTYGTPMQLYVNAPTLPDGYKILWKAEGKGVELEPSATGRICTVNATSTGNVVVSAYVVNASGNTVTDSNGKQVMDAEYLYTKANVFMKIFEIFKKLLGFDWTSKLY